MPVIEITLLEGRSKEQKQRIAARMTDVLAEEAKTPREGVVVAFIEVRRENYARGGVLMSDQPAK
ncbi:MAG: 2-hydroxymuconate tautomerase [Candidatus Acidiferrum sp.]